MGKRLHSAQVASSSKARIIKSSALALGALFGFTAGSSSSDTSQQNAGGFGVAYAADGSAHTGTEGQRGRREVYAWGSTQYGQLGLGIQTGDMILAPTRVTALDSMNPKKIIANNETVMVITDEGEVFLWGRGDNYVLGPQQLRNIPTPTRLLTGYNDPDTPPSHKLPGGMPRIVDGAISRTHGCAIDEFGRLWTWGARAIARAARPPAAEQDTKEERAWWGGRVARPASNLEERSTASVVMSEAVPVSAFGHPFEPRPVTPPEWAGHKVVSVACGLNHTVAVLDDGRVFAWGSSSDGVLGLPPDAIQKAQAEQKPILAAQNLKVGEELPRDFVLNPQLVQGALASKRAVKVACGKRHTLVLCDDGTVCTFGDDGYGQMGQGLFALRYQSEPKQVDTLLGHRIVDIAAGESHVACVTDKGLMFSWGLGGDGQMGVGGKTLRNPLPVLNTPLLENGVHVKSVACGGGHTAALDTEGDLWMFGRGQYGQLGRGLHVEAAAAWRDKPVKLDFEAEGLGNVRVEQVTLGTDSSFALVSRQN